MPYVKQYEDLGGKGGLKKKGRKEWYSCFSQGKRKEKKKTENVHLLWSAVIYKINYPHQLSPGKQNDC